MRRHYFKPLTLRQRVFDRDRGVCSLCGLRTSVLARWGYSTAGWSAAFRRWEERMVRRGRFVYRVPNHRRNLWDADHVHARADGGVDTLGNLRTLCIYCHARRSAGQSTERARVVRSTA